MVAAGLAAALALATATAHADTVAVIARAPTAAPVAPGPAAAAVSAAARAAGAEVRRDPWAWARQRLVQGAIPAARLRRFAHIGAGVRAGWRLYLAVEPEAAVRQLQQVQKQAEAVLDLQGGLVVYADIALRLGVVFEQLGRTQQAAAAMRLAAALDPARVVSIADFAPDAVSAYEAARTAAVPTVRVRVHSDPAGAAIEVDGKLAGTAPVAVTVAAGAHVVVARAPDHHPVAQVVTVAPGQATVELALVPNPWGAAIGRGAAALHIGQQAASVQTAVAGLLRYGELDSTVLVASVWRRGAPALLGQRCVGAGGDPAGRDLSSFLVRCTEVVEIGYDRPESVAAAATALWDALLQSAPRGRPTLLADVRLVRADGPPVRAGAQTGACSWCRSPWLWLGVGTTAVTAATLWTLLRHRNRTPVVSVDPCDFGGCPP